MITDPKIQKMIREALPGIVKTIDKTANNPEAKPANRIKAVELLLRVALSPSNHPVNTAALKSNAEAALVRLVPFLTGVVKSNKHGRNYLKAVQALLLIAKLGHTEALDVFE